MDLSFRGSETQTIDSKGRVSIPATFRRVLEEGDPNWTDGLRAKVIIVFGPAKQNFLKCYTVAGIQSIERRIKRMKLGSVERKALETIYHGLAMDLPVLEDGRILLPAKLREKLALKKEAFFIAKSDKFEIWNPETYAAENDPVELWLEQMGDDFDPEFALPDDDDADTSDA